jgi:hypothetical protein
MNGLTWDSQCLLANTIENAQSSKRTHRVSVLRRFDQKLALSS